VSWDVVRRIKRKLQGQDDDESAAGAPSSLLAVSRAKPPAIS